MKKSNKSFDFDKFLDNVFLHGKNADERLFDLILRSITFIVILLFVFLFSTVKVHADDSQYLDVLLLGDNTLGLQPYFNNTDWANVKEQFPDTPYNSSIFGFVSETPGHVVLTSDMDIESCYCAIGRCYWSGSSDSANALFIDKDLAINNHVTLLYDGYIYSDSDVSAYVVWFNKRQSLNTSLYTVYNITIPSGITEFRNISPLLYGSTFYWYLSNLPMLNTHDSTLVSQWLSSGDNVESVFNVNYLEVNDLCVSPVFEETESSKNHLALSDVQIGLSSFEKEMTDLSESSVIIGVGVDDNWILSHMNDYTVGIEYHFYIKDSNMNQSDPISMYNQTIPLSYFKDSPVTYGVANLMSSSMIAPFPSNRNFYSYYRSLSSDYGQKVVTREHRDGFFPAALKSLYRYTIGGYYIDNPVTTNNTIFEFYLDVSVRLMAGGETGGYYTKRFDFKRGTVSILDADAFQNPNPWEGPTSPESEYDPNVPSGSSGSSSGGGASAVAYGGNVNVVINNNNKLGDLVGDDDDSPSSTISEYLSAIDEMKGSIETLTNEDDEEITSSKSFNQFLKDNLETFPGMNLMISVIKIVVGICLIIIAIKLLLAIF